MDHCNNPGRDQETATSTTQATTPLATDNNAHTPESEVHETSDSVTQKPEDCWGDLDYDCRLCCTSRMFCPGCTQGLICEVGHEDLFMGCDVLLRCPLCVGEEEAYADKDFWQRHYWDDETDLTVEYSRMQKADIEKKYPGWLSRSLSGSEA